MSALYFAGWKGGIGTGAGTLMLTPEKLMAVTTVIDLFRGEQHSAFNGIFYSEFRSNCRLAQYFQLWNLVRYLNTANTPFTANTANTANTAGDCRFPYLNTANTSNTAGDCLIEFKQIHQIHLARTREGKKGD